MFKYINIYNIKCFILGILVLSVVSLIVFDIIALVQNSYSDISNKCKESATIWIYLLMCVIVTSCKFMDFIRIKIDIFSDIEVIGHLSVYIFPTIWGYFELWHNVSCIDNIENLLVYNMAYINFIISLTISLTISLIVIFTFISLMITTYCCGLCKSFCSLCNKEEEETNNDITNNDITNNDITNNLIII